MSLRPESAGVGAERSLRHEDQGLKNGTGKRASGALGGATNSAIPQSALVAARAADDKLGQDTVVLAMGELFGVVDAFVVTSGRNVRQVRTLVEEVEERVKELDGTGPTRVEGLRDATWVLMDYGDFVVHVFAEETRSYYDLEHLWSSAPRVPWREEVGVGT